MKAFTVTGGTVAAAGVVCALVGLFVAEARIPLLIVGVSLVPFGLIFFFTGRKIGSVEWLRPSWISAGDAATGLITGIRETSVRVNQRPVLGFDIEVHRAGEAPYPAQVQQPVPMALLGSIEPGRELGVVVHPDDPQRIAIDWSRGHPTDTEPDLGGMSLEEITAAVRAVPADRRHLAAETLRRGRRGRATITLMQRIGELVDLGMVEEGDSGWEDDLFLVGLDVKLPGMDRYPAQVLHRVPNDLVGKIGPGLEVEIAADRDDPRHQVAIDWEPMVT